MCSRDGRRRWPWICDGKRGQHRVRMMALLAEERRKVQEKGGVSVGVGGDKLDSLDLENVLVKVFEPRQSRDNVGRRAVPATEAGGGIGDDNKLSMAATFTKINKAEPVKLLNLPSVATKRTRDIIDHAAPHFRDAYPTMFATLAQCHASHLNLDNLCDALFTSGVIWSKRLGSSGKLVRWMLTRNNKLRGWYGDGNGDADGDGNGNRTSAKR